MEELIFKLKERDIDLDLVDDQLKLNIPEGVDVTDLIEEIRLNKPKLVKFLAGIKKSKAFRVIRPAGKKEYYALSPIQRRMYFLYEFDRQATSYNVPEVIRLEGNLSKEKLQDTFKVLINRHESLRTYFVVEDNEPVQKILDNVDFELEYGTAQQTDDVHKLIREFVRPFNLRKAPLFRVRLIAYSADDHILMVDAHHIITDGISQSILIKDFMAIYNGDILPPLRIQYKDYAEWMNSEEEKMEMHNQKEFWLEEFADDIVPLELPTDFQRPLVKNENGGAIEFVLSKAETLQITALAEQEGVTEYIIMLAFYYVLLSKLSHTDDVVVGTPTAGRHHTDVESLVGMFVTILLIRANPKQDISFFDFIGSLRTKMPACYDNQDYLYEELVEALKLSRDTSRNPLFDAMFSFQNFEQRELKIPGLKLNPVKFEHNPAQFDLTFVVLKEEVFYCKFIFSNDLFVQETVNKFAGYFKKIVNATLCNSNIKIGDIDIIDDREKTTILSVFNNTKRLYPTDTTFLNLFHEQVSSVPDNIAVTLEDTSMSYVTLDRVSNKVCQFLLDRIRIATNEFVLILSGKSIWSVASVLGIWKAGAAYVPVDVNTPKDRLNYIINEIKPKLIITDKASFDKHGQGDQIGNVPVLMWDGEKQYTEFQDHIYSYRILEQYGVQPSGVKVSGDNIAYAIYTSGSTGQPKGVVVQHQQYVNAALAWRDEYKLGEMPVNLLQLASVAFDVFLGDMARALANGGNLVLVPTETVLLHKKLVELINGHEISILESTPALVTTLMDFVYDNNINIDTLKLLIIGADICKFESFRKIVERFGNKIRVINSYGLTETTIDTSYYEEVPEHMPSSGVVPIGKPLPNMRMYILNDRRQLQPIGVTGEIYVGGRGVAQGYINRTQLNKERFIDDPFCPGDRIYRTGDLGKWQPDGNVQILGRADNQVKIRGFRVELGEIEQQLTQYPYISESIATVAVHGEDKYLIAYYRADQELNVPDMKTFLSAKLPDYMVPVYYVRLDTIPLTPNGKVNRRALPVPEMISLDNYIPPTTEIECALVNLWAQILNLENGQISINKSFFELGGQSLKAITFINRAYKTFNVELSLQDFFINSDIASMAKKIASYQWLSEETKQENTITNELII